MMSSSGPHLSLWKRGLSVVPGEVWRRIDLESLVLAGNGLSEISERVGDLNNLRMLDLGHNKLHELPDSIGRLEGLSDFLYLHDNRLATLPSSFARLERLRYLNISENAFEVLPEVVTEMSLRVLRDRSQRTKDFAISRAHWMNNWTPGVRVRFLSVTIATGG